MYERVLFLDPKKSQKEKNCKKDILKKKKKIKNCSIVLLGSPDRIRTPDPIRAIHTSLSTAPPRPCCIINAGTDARGVRRELFTLLEKEVKPKYIDSVGCFNHNICALYENVYFRLGQLVAMSVVQGGLDGSSFVVSPSTYKFISGTSISKISETVSVSEVSDTLVRDFLNKMSIADNVEDFRQLYSENFSLVSENGVTKPYCSISLEEKDDIRKMICLNFIIMKCLAELQQFCSGLESLEVLEEIRKSPDEFESFFLRKKELSAETVFKIVSMDVTYSLEEEERQKEECTLAMFLNYLEDIQKGLVCDESRTVNLYRTHSSVLYRQ
uniref:Uncharacterized protein n=2 Tax=Amphimedon queenslandica TaxID=400682 RepID=A0A1X7TXQ8_AMPQE